MDQPKADRKQRVAHMQRAYQRAMVKLRNNHPDEFRGLLMQAYEDMDITVRMRRTAAEIKQDEIQKAREILRNANEPTV